VTRREFGAGVAGALFGASEAGSIAQAAPAPDSDVGSLLPFVESQVVKAPTLSFLNGRFHDAAAWRKVARARLLELLHYSPKKCDPKPELLERVDMGDHFRERIRFNTTPDIRVPAFVLVPKNLRGRAPAIVNLHDHGGFYLWGKEKLVALEGEHASLTRFRNDYYGGKSTAVELVRQGYVVIVIDMFYWGERRMLLKDDPADWRERPASMLPERVGQFNQRAGQNEDLVSRTIQSAGFNWPGVMLWDDIRTVDYLVSRPDVDPKRIGCVGLSVGGFRACHLTALDDRIKAGVVVGWMCSFPRQLRKHVRNTIGHTMLIPGLYKQLDYPDVASLAIPRALLVINGSKDGLFELNGVKASFNKLNGCYLKAGVLDKLKTSLYETPHEFNAEMQAEAWDWLKKWV
jgi:dienelactone hydrolase